MPTPAGWYDDGQGQVRWWDGSAWTEHVQGPKSSQGLKSSALKWIGASIKKAVDDRVAAERQQYAEGMARQTAAGQLLTKGEFGGRCIEVYEGGYVRIMSHSESSSEARTRRNTFSHINQVPYERLISVSFIEDQESPTTHAPSTTSATAIQAVSGLIGGGDQVFTSWSRRSRGRRWRQSCTQGEAQKINVNDHDRHEHPRPDQRQGSGLRRPRPRARRTHRTRPPSVSGARPNRGPRITRITSGYPRVTNPAADFICDGPSQGVGHTSP